MIYAIARVAIGMCALSVCCACNNSTENAKTEKDTVLTTNNVMPANNAFIEDTVTYNAGTQQFKNYVAFKNNDIARMPVVLVIPEWWGVNDYTRSRVKLLAALGYFAMAVDMYGDGKVADNPTDAGNAAMPFYKDPKLAARNFDAALAKAKTYPQADTSKIGVIGYCFGGSMALNMARLGENLKAVVSFHGDLDNHGLIAKKGTIKPAILVCHGEADPYVPAKIAAAFKKEMAVAGANMQFIGYPGAKHAFTNPGATAIGEKFKMDIKYNEAADKASWEAMKTFFSKTLH